MEHKKCGCCGQVFSSRGLKNHERNCRRLIRRFPFIRQLVAYAKSCQRAAVSP